MWDRPIRKQDDDDDDYVWPTPRTKLEDYIRAVFALGGGLAAVVAAVYTAHKAMHEARQAAAQADEARCKACAVQQGCCAGNGEATDEDQSDD